MVVWSVRLAPLQSGPRRDGQYSARLPFYGSKRTVADSAGDVRLRRRAQHGRASSRHPSAGLCEPWSALRRYRDSPMGASAATRRLGARWCAPHGGCEGRQRDVDAVRRRSSALEGLDAVTVITVSPLLRELIQHLQTADLDGAPRARVEGVVLDQLRVARVAPLERRLLRDPRLRAIADIYETNPRDQRNLRELGEHIGASERTLQRLFHRETGTTFGRWRTQVRLHHAIVSLGQGHTVTTAATEAGYRETSAFIAAFRKTFGTTPGRYFTEVGPL